MCGNETLPKPIIKLCVTVHVHISQHFHYRRICILRWRMSGTTKLATNLKQQRATMQSYPHGQATCFRRSLGNYNSLEEQQSLEKYHVFKCRIALYSRKSYHVNLECDFATLRSGESDSFHICNIYIYTYLHIYIYIYK